MILPGLSIEKARPLVLAAWSTVTALLVLQPLNSEHVQTPTFRGLSIQSMLPISPAHDIGQPARLRTCREDADFVVLPDGAERRQPFK